VKFPDLAWASASRETQPQAATGTGMNRARQFLGVGVVVVSVLGCSSSPPLETETSGETGSNTDASETGHDTTGHRETGDTTTGHRDTGDTTTGHSETGQSETTGDTTGEGDDPCPALCQVQDECAPDPFFTYADCLAVCAMELEVAAGAPACPPALTELYTCVGGLTCEQFDVLWDDPEGPCFDGAVAFDEHCAEALTCELGGGGDEQGSYCSYQFDCYGSGLHRVECSAGTGCTCLVEGVEVGSCDELYPALCEPIDPVDPNQANMQILGYMNECCGWTLEI
jgi:hypothetical protein